MTKDEYINKATHDFIGLLQQMDGKKDEPVAMAAKISMFLNSVYEDAVKLEEERNE